MAECIVCIESGREMEVLDTVFNACPHSNVCVRCSALLTTRRCPTCRRPIDPAYKPPVGLCSLVRQLSMDCEAEATAFAGMFGYSHAETVEGDCPFVLGVAQKDVDYEGTAKRISYLGLRPVVTARMMEDILCLVRDEFKSTAVLGAHGDKAWYWSGVPGYMCVSHIPASMAKRRLVNLRDALAAADRLKEFIVPCKLALNEAGDELVYQPTIDHPDFLFVDGCPGDHARIPQCAHKLTDPAVEAGPAFFTALDACIVSLERQLAHSRRLLDLGACHPVFSGVNLLDCERAESKIAYLYRLNTLTRAWVDGEFRFCAWDAETTSWQPRVYTGQGFEKYMPRAVLETVLRIAKDGRGPLEEEHGALKLVDDSLRVHYECFRIAEDQERLVNLKSILEATKWPRYVSPYDFFAKSAVCMAHAIQRADRHARAGGGLLREAVPIGPEIVFHQPTTVARPGKRQVEAAVASPSPDSAKKVK